MYTMACMRRFLSIFPFLLAAFNVGVPFSENGSSSLKFPPGHPRNCPLADGVYRFEVLPGAGWDNLRNQDMGVVFARNYSGCETSDDGKFLIPDNMVLYPVKNSKVERFAEFYDHWNDYYSVTTKTINAEASAACKKVSISGSFSSEFQSVKIHQVEDKSVTTRVQIRHDLYKAKLEPGSALQPAFKSRILEIASHLQHNNTAFANYLAQSLVRDYGTHYITSVNAGAVLAKVDHLTKKYAVSIEGEKNKITAAASLSFFQLFSAKMSYSHSTEKQNMDEYENNTVYSTIYTFGGPPFRVNFSISQWENQLLDELVAIDRAGNPLHFSISTGNLPEVSENLVFEVRDVVKRAIKQYYQRNTIKGCTKLDAPNFSFQANFDDGSCKKPGNRYTFGGVYQTCQFVGHPVDNPCEPLLQKNPLTSDYSCSAEYEPILLHQGSTPHSCRRECHSCGVFWLSTCCQEICANAFYETYWCVAKGQVPHNTGYLFGGLYSHMITNPVTEARSCPLKFYPLRFGLTMHVCVSDDYEMSSEEAVPFGGFFSCNNGNPLSNTGTLISHCSTKFCGCLYRFVDNITKCVGIPKGLNYHIKTEIPGIWNYSYPKS